LTQKVEITNPNGVKLMSISSAMEAVTGEDGGFDSLSVALSIIRILERVTGVMERNALLETQRANLAKLSSRDVHRVSVAGVSSESRRQIIDTQRLIESTTDMIAKMTDDIVKTITEFVEGNDVAIDPRNSVLGIDESIWVQIIANLVDVLLVSSAQAISVVDDKKKRELMACAIRNSGWVHAIIPKNRIDDILEEIA
jgi:hypothetical protein